MTPEERGTKLAKAIHASINSGASITPEQSFALIKSASSDAIRFAEIDAIRMAAKVAEENGASQSVVDAILKMTDDLKRSSRR